MRHRVGKLSLAICGPILMLSASLDAATVHVAPSGRDANPGTADRPVATMRRALELALSRDEPSEIILAAGTYPGDVHVGKPEERLTGPKPPLVIRAAQRPDGGFEDVVFDGGRKIAKAEAVPGKPGVFRFPGKYSYHRGANLWEADTRTRYTLAADLASVERYPASFWFSPSEVFFHTSDDRPPKVHEVGASQASAGITLWRPNTTVRGIQFRSFLNWRWSCGVELRGADTAAEDCRVWNSVRGIQIMLDAPRTRVVRCRTDDCGGGIYSQGKHAVIEDCRLHKVRDAFAVLTYPQDDTAIQFYHPASEGEVRRCLGVGFCNGIFVKCPVSEFLVEHNTMVDGITYGMGCTTWHPKSVFRHNIVVGFSEPIIWPDQLAPTVVVDCNCLWGLQGKAALQRHLERLRKIGAGRSSIAADPRFAAPAAGDYRLLGDSPCAKMGPEGERCGAFGVVGNDFRDSQPPAVTLACVTPAVRSAAGGDLYLERDPWLGGARNRWRPRAPEAIAGEWLTPGRAVTLEILAEDAISRPSQMKIRVGRGDWSEPEPFQARKTVDLSADAGPIRVGVTVCDAAGNWSKPAVMLVRVAAHGPRLLADPSVRTNPHGAVVSLETDVPCRVRLELGTDPQYGATVEPSPNVHRMWVAREADAAGCLNRRVSNHLTLVAPAVKSGVTYHYRLVLEDELGNKTVTNDRTFALANEARTYCVSPQGEDLEENGSRQRPWRTLQFAVDRALPGDRIVLLPGLYPGETTLTRGGLADAPITIEAEPPGAAILDARHELPSCLRLEKAPHVAIKGLELRWFGRPDTFYSHDKSGVSLVDSPGVRVSHCTIWNDFWTGWPIGSGIRAVRSPDLAADHNVIFEMEQGIHLYFSPRARITHNTILMNMYGAVQFLYSAEGSVSRNNSFCFSGNDQYVVLHQHQREFETFDSDYNNLGTKLRSPDPGDDIVPKDPLFRSHGSKAVVSLNHERYNSLKAWQQATGKDRHSIFKDPLYVDAEHWDFRLQAGSPNIGAGEGGATIGALGQ